MKLRVLFIIIFAATLTGNSYAAESPKNFLRGLYKKHIERFKKNEYWFNNKKELSQYFDTDLTSLFLKDEQCKEKTREICNLDFDPILDAQDFDEKYPYRLKVEKVPNKAKVLYRVTFTNMGTRIIIYELKETSYGWRITDISYSSGTSLKKILSANL